MMLPEEDLEWLLMLSETEDKDSNTCVEQPQQSASAVKKGFQIGDDLIDYLFEVWPIYG
jgi:hypothetical protein